MKTMNVIVRKWLILNYDALVAWTLQQEEGMSDLMRSTPKKRQKLADDCLSLTC